MNKYNREKHLETVLKQIISKYFYRGEGKSSLHDLDGNNLFEVDHELCIQLFELIPEVMNEGRG